MLDEVANLVVDCISGGGKVLTFGVGGNAANAIHLAAELAGKFERYENPLPCIDLCSNPSTITAIANDFGWEFVFSRQIKALARPEDVVIALSIGTSGRYLGNALTQALETCRAVLICGKSTLGPSSPNLLVWELGSSDTPWVQEEQLRTIHRLCSRIKSRLVGYGRQG